VDRSRALGVALVLVSACGFGSGALFAKPVYGEGVGWHVLLTWRFLVGAALAWAFLLSSPSRRRGLLALDRRAVVVALALGVLYVGNSGTYYAGLESVDASLAALIVYIYPALVAVLSLRIGRPLEGARAWLALGLALAGVALTIGGINATNAPPVGALLLVVASPVIYAVWIVLAARLSGERRSAPDDGEPNGTAGTAGAAGAAASAATALMMTATALVYWVTALAAGQLVGPGSIPAAAWPGVLAIGAVATFLAIQGFYAGAQRVGAAQAALLSTIEPLWTVGLAALLLHETLSPIQLAGGALILAGVIVAQTGPASVRSARPAVRLADE
jgi:drug/metabolite transporter (DMT)-like permease